MAILLSRIVPRDQIVAVHALLGEVGWPGTVEHIEVTRSAGVPLVFAPRHIRGDPARTGRGTGPLAVEQNSLAPSACRHSVRPDPAGIEPISQGPSPLRRAVRQRHGHARGKRYGGATTE